MKKRSQKNALYIYSLCSILVSVFSMFVLYYVHTLSIMTILLGIFLFLFLLLIPIYLVSKNITFQKIQWIVAIILFLSSIFVIQTKPTISPSEKQYFGLDISRWNGDVDLQKLTITIDFIIIRCGYTSNVDGTTHKIDDQFKKNLKQCQALDIPYGVYYYSLANTPKLAKEEAKYTLSLLDGTIPPLGVYIDVEDESYQGHLTKTQMTDVVLAYTDYISDSGNQIGVYANYSWWENKLDHDALSSHFKWIAFYDEDYTMEEAYDMHQYTNQGVLDGFVGTYDLNIAKERFW